jgi:hypothetical protein
MAHPVPPASCDLPQLRGLTLNARRVHGANVRDVDMHTTRDVKAKIEQALKNTEFNLVILRHLNQADKFDPTASIDTAALVHVASPSQYFVSIGAGERPLLITGHVAHDDARLGMDDKAFLTYFNRQRWLPGRAEVMAALEANPAAPIVWADMYPEPTANSRAYLWNETILDPRATGWRKLQITSMYAGVQKTKEICNLPMRQMEVQTDMSMALEDHLSCLIPSETFERKPCARVDTGACC